MLYQPSTTGALRFLGGNFGANNSLLDSAYGPVAGGLDYASAYPSFSTSAGSVNFNPTGAITFQVVGAAAVVPEPVTVALTAAGLGGVAAVARRRRAHA